MLFNAVQPSVNLMQFCLGKVNYSYHLRNNKKNHQRATTQITDPQVEDYRKTIKSSQQTF